MMREQEARGHSVGRRRERETGDGDGRRERDEAGVARKTPEKERTSGSGLCTKQAGYCTYVRIQYKNKEEVR